MKRELWSIGCTFGYAIRVLNSIFCDGEIEKELSEDEKWLVAEQVNSMCSDMMIEDAQDILTMVNSMVTNRLCERVDCQYHHPKTPHTHTFCDMFKDKCEECIHNEKSKTPDDDKIEHFECE